MERADEQRIQAAFHVNEEQQALIEIEVAAMTVHEVHEILRLIHARRLPGLKGYFRQALAIGDEEEAAIWTGVAGEQAQDAAYRKAARSVIQASAQKPRYKSRARI